MNISSDTALGSLLQCNPQRNETRNGIRVLVDSVDGFVTELEFRCDDCGSVKEYGDHRTVVRTNNTIADVCGSCIARDYVTCHECQGKCKNSRSVKMFNGMVICDRCVRDVYLEMFPTRDDQNELTSGD
jgi:hypothetical protein